MTFFVERVLVGLCAIHSQVGFFLNRATVECVFGFSKLLQHAGAVPAHH